MGCVRDLEKAISSCYLGNYGLLFHTYDARSCQDSKFNKKMSIFIIECMSHLDLARYSRFLGIYWLLGRAYEDENFLESKIT